MYSSLINDRQAEAIATVTSQAMYSDEQREEYAKIIKDFNRLYHDIYRQTWCATQWKGISVLKPPTDLWIYQEIVQQHLPDLIIETGTMRGGSAVFLSDICRLMNPSGNVVSIDTQRENIDSKAFQSDVWFLTGSSIDVSVVEQVKAYQAKIGAQSVMVILDSDHTEAHVTKELEIYSELVTVGMPLIVEDTGNCDGARVAVEKWIEKNPKFHIDYECEKFMLTFSRGGFLERVS